MNRTLLKYYIRNPRKLAKPLKKLIKESEKPLRLRQLVKSLINHTSKEFGYEDEDNIAMLFYHSHKALTDDHMVIRRYQHTKGYKKKRGQHPKGYKFYYYYLRRTRNAK